MEQDIVIEGPDENADGKPDWIVRLHINDKRLWVVIVLLGTAATICSKLWGMW